MAGGGGGLGGGGGGAEKRHLHVEWVVCAVVSWGEVGGVFCKATLGEDDEGGFVFWGRGRCFFCVARGLVV